MARIDIEGRQIGWLTVLEKMPYAENSHRAMYKCRCQCGKEDSYERGKLLRGNYVACFDCSVSSSNRDIIESLRVEVAEMFDKEQKDARTKPSTRKKNNTVNIDLSLSDEQQDFVNKALSGNNILVDACIGSGKTTAIQYLCNEFPNTKKILYLTYNRLLKLDAKARIRGKNITVNNYHGFAYGVLLQQFGKKVNPSDQIQIFIKYNPDIEPYDVLIIDEYQDIDQELSEMLDIIKAKSPGIQIIAVGDMEQKIYDKTSLKIEDFISGFLDDYIKLEFTKCFRLSRDLAAKLGRIWRKRIDGVNEECNVLEMSEKDVVDFLAHQDTQDILCLGSRTGKMSDVLNKLEESYPEKFNKKTVFASIQDRDSGSVSPKKDSAIFTTFDSSKGLERKICVIFDFTESYWDTRINNPQVKYHILRNIFCVAASRGKNQIIFVKYPEAMLTEETLSTFVKEREDFGMMDISAMFDFKYKEDVEACYNHLNIKEIQREDYSLIPVKNSDDLIDISPCIGIYQDAAFFDNYNIDVAIALQLLLKGHLKYLFTEDVKQSSVEHKTLFLTSIETNQERYRKQVSTPFISEEHKQKILDRLATEFSTDELAQVECKIGFSDMQGGLTRLEARGQADVVRDDTVYELKFVSETKHEHFLQCACYMVALKLNRGILWNTKDNKMYEIKIPNIKEFMDLVARAITKGVFNNYYEATGPYVKSSKEDETTRMNFAVIDAETTWSDKVMSIGVAVADSETQELITAAYYLITPECNEGGMYSNRLSIKGADPVLTGNRAAVLDELRCFLQDNGVDTLMAYNAKFDLNHLPELSDYKWCDIMKLASNKQYNSKIPSNADCYKNGRMKRGYGVENIMRMLLGSSRYTETHNAFYDAVDELKIVQLLGHSIDTYDEAVINEGTTKTNKSKMKFKPIVDLEPVYDSNIPNKGPRVSKNIGFGTCSSEEAANMLGVSKSTVYNMIKRGQIYGKKQGNKYCISIESINRYIERKRRAMLFSIAFSAGAVILMLFLLLNIM